MLLGYKDMEKKIMFSIRERMYRGENVYGGESGTIYISIRPEIDTYMPCGGLVP